MRLTVLPPLYPPSAFPASSPGKALRFGHTEKPQPEDTKEWLQTFALDLFKPHEILPNKPAATENTKNPETKNIEKQPHILMKPVLWLQALAKSFIDDLKHFWQWCRTKK